MIQLLNLVVVGGCMSVQFKIRIFSQKLTGNHQASRMCSLLC